MASQYQLRWNTACRLTEALPKLLSPTPTEAPLPLRSRCKLACSEFSHLTGYRSVEQEHSDLWPQLTAALTAHRSDSAVVVTSHSGEIGFYLAAPTGKGASLRRAVSGILPMTGWKEVSPWDETSPVYQDYPYGGVIGGLCPAALDMDGLLRSLSGDWAAALLIHPCPSASLLQEAQTFDRIKALLEPFSTRSVPKGNQVRQLTNPRILSTFQLAQQAGAQTRNRAAQRCFELSLWFGAKDPVTASQLGQLLAQSLIPAEEDGLRIPYPQMLEQTTFSFDGLYLPWAPGPGLPGGFQLPLFENPLTALFSEQELAALLPIPRDAHPGFSVLLPSRDASCYHEYDIQPHEIHGQPIPLGQIVGSSLEEAVGTASLGEHMLIAGASGAGKSTTITGIAGGLNRLSIPFVLFEPVKGEFSKLPDYGIPLRVLSSGMTGEPLRFNPFVPEPMTGLYSHIKGLVTAITAASDNLAPIPQALELVMKEAYRRHGWQIHERCLLGDSRTFPTFRELRDLVIPYFKDSRLYQGEVKTNVSSALFVRLSALADYPFLQSGEKLPTREILSQNTTIQFDGLDTLPDKCFFANALLLNLNEALRQEPADGNLRHVLILDEAHNFFLKVPEDQNSSSAAVSQYFGNLLSEIRANGCGLIIADQRPDILNPSVIENTAVKVLHALEDSDDIKAAAGALGLSDHQKDLFHSLPPGRAIVSVRGQRPVVQIQVAKPQPVRQRPSAVMCSLCPYGHLCCSEEAEVLLEGFPVLDCCASLTAAMAQPEALDEVIRSILREADLQHAPPPLQLCFFGKVAEHLPGPLYRQFFDSYFAERRHLL